MPELFGGAADLTASTKTIFKNSAHFAEDPAGRNVFFGVRELGMCAAVNGMAVHGGLKPFGSTFFVFSDYAKPALRIAAIMEAHSLFVFTHDSIGVGEDGPTHEPIEHLMALRAVPHMTDFRPADANETAAVWRLALERKGPAFFALTRQDVPVIDAVEARHVREREQGRVCAGRRGECAGDSDWDGLGSERGAGRGEAAGGAKESARAW